MDRTPQHQTGLSRRFSAGVTLVAVAATVVVATAFASSVPPRRTGERTFPNPSGASATVGWNDLNAGNPFFQPLGTNGRSCVTCHQPAQAWSITPAELRDRFDRTEGLDPIFRTNDGSNCEGADVSTIRQRRRAFSLLLQAEAWCGQHRAEAAPEGLSPELLELLKKFAHELYTNGVAWRSNAS